jgi:two-component system, NarL family, response regulator DegU
MSSEITLLIADDHPIFRQGLKEVIARDPQLKVVAEAADGAAALDQLAASGARIAILDVDMPQKDGFEVARAIAAQRLVVDVVFLTMHRDQRFLHTALELGVRGYVLKDAALSEIVRCIRAVAAGQDYISPELSGVLINRHRQAAAFAAANPGVDQLTPTERRVLALIAQFKMSKDIASELCISVRTVEHHRSNIVEKLRLTGVNALLKFALEHQAKL